MAKVAFVEFPTERNQTDQSVEYALARGSLIRPDELQMLLMLHDDPSALLAKLKEAGWKSKTKR